MQKLLIWWAPPVTHTAEAWLLGESGNGIIGSHENVGRKAKDVINDSGVGILGTWMRCYNHL